MNLEEYFKRTGFHGSFKTPDLETLKLIHRHHVMSVPFENLSIHSGEKIVLDPEVIFDKIVRRGRGGWCFENNCLFGWVLREMGYDTTTLGSRVFNSTTNTFPPTETHLVNMVNIQGKAYLADVSFGMSYQLWEPLELVFGKDQPQEGGVYRLTDRDDMWVLEKTRRQKVVLSPEFTKSNLLNQKETSVLYGFTLVPRDLQDFLEANHNHQIDPNSLFTNKSICSLQTPAGFRALVGFTYSEVCYKPEEGIDTFDMRNLSEEELEKVLWEKFNIKLQNKLLAVNKKMYYTI